jgi:DNA segregation ATPase FtsK/SpoIIIE-like protein
MSKGNKNTLANGSLFDEIVLEVIKDFFIGLRLYNLKLLIKDKKLRALYVFSTVGTFAFLVSRVGFDYPKLEIVSSIFSYFLFRSIKKNLKDAYYRYFRYKSFTKEFDNKVKIIDVKKDKINKTTTYTVHCFKPKKEMLNKVDDLVHYFKSNITIEEHKHNPRLIYITTSPTKKTNAKKFKQKYYLRDYIATKPTGEIPYLLGIDEKGNTVLGDLAKEKQVQISGDTGGGKSTIVNSLLLSMMCMNDNIAYFLVDFKWVELKIYEKLNNVRFVDEDKFFDFLEELNNELDRRKKIICDAELQNIKQYNSKKTKNNQLPYIVLLIDEIADIKLNGTDKKTTERIENILTRLLNQGRALGIHCIFATQKPSGVQLSTQIRSGLVTKISFRIEEPRSQDMAGIKGTEDLQDGEFKIKRVGKSKNIETLKGFFVDRIEEWSIFEMLEKKIGGNLNDKRNNIINLNKKI